MSTPRPWIPQPTAEAIDRDAARYRAMTSDGIDDAIHATVQRHEQFMDRQCISLYAGTNVLNPRAAALLSASVGTRPSLGWPGDKYETGMQHAEQLEIIATELLTQLFGCRFAEFRVASGSLANLYAYMATTKPGDTILAFSDAAAGHVTHHQAGAAGLYGLTIHDVPFDAPNMTIDLPALREQAHATRPKLIIVAGSMCLFPYPVAAVREIADEVGAYVMYDAAHMSGLIAGGEFQQPLVEGAHLMTSSTYKSFGGPPSGMILTDDAELAQRLDAIAYPGLTANFDLSRTAALSISVLDLIEHGKDYARTCIANAQALAASLVDHGLPVHHVEGKGHTASQHVAIHAHAYGGGTTASRHLEQANILTSGIGLPVDPVEGDFNAIRIGTQEITRWGLTPDDMPAVAALIGRGLATTGAAALAALADEVTAYRTGFQDLHFIRHR